MKKEIKLNFPGGKRVNAFYKGMTIQTDQPLYAGGEGTAPAPFDLFLASIGTCVAYYVLEFCQRRGIPTHNSEVVMEMEKNKERNMIEKIFFHIKLPSQFPEKYKKAVIKSVNSCAVKDHMINPPTFEFKTHIQEE
ncbi:OsmC family protein [bacterium]|nr:OsmC family protein [bacterium]